ncbi:MAG TPA: serine/threonine protein kinase [Thermoanaerobaculia bacterium]|jgi:serine/threonine-protein kinase|nr:serine/threonine protein kinase [Thermoanaerobaculia bacterium]
MPRFRFTLLARVALALAAVGLLPLVISYFGLVGVNRDALLDQVLKTHALAAQTAAGRVGAFLDTRLALARGLAGNRALADPHTPEAQELLVQSLQTWSSLGVEAVAVVNNRGETVMRVQLKDEGSRRRAEAGLAGPWPEPVSIVAAIRPPVVRISAPLPQGAGAVRLVCEGSLLDEVLHPEDLGQEAVLALAGPFPGGVPGGRLLLSSDASLGAFPPVLVANALSGRIRGSGRFVDRRGREVLGSSAPVPETDWVVLSRQPAQVAEAVAARLNRRSALAFGSALLLIAALSGVAWIAIVRPIRDLARAQRELAKASSAPPSGNEIDDLRRSFDALRRGISEREALGDVFLGRYQVVEFIATGGMGTVFRGWDPKLQRPVALKTVRLGVDLLADKRAQLITQLVREAVTAARFSHPNVVAVYDVEDAPDGAFMALELVDGVSLEHLLLRRGRLSPQEVAPLGAAIAHGLAAAHARDIVHRDVKPANVLLGRDGSIKVTDFGIADFVAAASRAEGLVFGTPGYLPPESLRGAGHTRAGDLFALGVILYESLTGAKPFGGVDVPDMIQSTLFGVLKAPSARTAGIPSELETLVILLLERDPGRRPSNAAAVAEELDRIDAKHAFRWHYDDAIPQVPQSPVSLTLEAQWLPTTQLAAQ